MFTVTVHTVPTPPKIRLGHGGSSLGMSHPFLNVEHWSPWCISYWWTHTTLFSKRDGAEPLLPLLSSQEQSSQRSSFWDSLLHAQLLNLSKLHKTLVEQSSSSRLLLQEPQTLPSQHTYSRPYQYLLISDHPWGTKKLHPFCTSTTDKTWPILWTGCQLCSCLFWARNLFSLGKGQLHNYPPLPAK